jgi:hypothetical protein
MTMTLARHAIRRLPLLALAALLLATAGCAGTPDRADALREAQYAWSAAIRWGDFEGAWTLVDPAYREAHPMTALEFSRYAQVRISGYDEGPSTVSGETATRRVVLGVVNANTQVQRQATYLEQWRHDPDTGRWWVESGLPDLWRD